MTLATRTMRAVVAHDHGDLRLEERPVPEIGPGEAIARVRACGICSGDVTPWYVRKKCPTVLGHEPAGEIVAIGPGVTRFSPGDRVFFHHHAPCMACRACARGQHVMCPTWRASQLDPGGLAELVRIPAVNLEQDTLHLPEGMSWETATLIEPLACVVKAMRRARLQAGDRVAILGLGVMGQMMVRLARHHGAELILASDRVPFRLQRGLELGADQVVDMSTRSFPEAVRELTGGTGADLVLVCPAHPAAVQEGIRCAGQASRVLMFMGPAPGTELTIDMNQVYFHEIDLISSYSCGPGDTREALALLDQGVVTSSQLVTHRFPLEQAQEACEVTAAAGDSLKVLVEIP